LVLTIAAIAITAIGYLTYKVISERIEKRIQRSVLNGGRRANIFPWYTWATASGTNTKGTTMTDCSRMPLISHRAPMSVSQVSAIEIENAMSILLDFAGEFSDTIQYVRSKLS